MKTLPKIEYISGFNPRCGSTEKWFIPFEEGQRTAKCMWCSMKSLSDERLPYFKLKATENMDEYYCGCFGWD